MPMSRLTRQLPWLLLLLPVLSVATAIAGDRLRVVYHINDSDPAHQAYALRTVQNHIDAEGADHLDIRVVLHGNGLSMLLLPEAFGHLKSFPRANADGQMIAWVDTLKDQGVRFEVCGATLRRRGVDAESDLYGVEPDEIVDSGVAELARLQQRGYIYIKP
jgi:hypothetical protein